MITWKAKKEMGGQCDILEGLKLGVVVLCPVTVTMLEFWVLIPTMFGNICMFCIRPSELNIYFVSA
jgi:hypothetical protein